MQTHKSVFKNFAYLVKFFTLLRLNVPFKSSSNGSLAKILIFDLDAWLHIAITLSVCLNLS